MNSELNVTGLRHGLLIGGICGITCLLLIMMGRELYLSLYGLMSFGIAITLVILWGIRERKNQFEDELKYVAGFVYASIAIFISYLMVQITHVAIVQIVDPGIQELIMSQGMEGVEQALEMTEGWVDTGDVDMDEMLDQAEIELQKSISFYGILANSAGTLIGSIVVGAIIALFLKKSKPDFAE